MVESARAFEFVEADGWEPAGFHDSGSAAEEREVDADVLEEDGEDGSAESEG